MGSSRSLKRYWAKPRVLLYPYTGLFSLTVPVWLTVTVSPSTSVLTSIVTVHSNLTLSKYGVYSESDGEFDRESNCEPNCNILLLRAIPIDYRYLLRTLRFLVVLLAELSLELSSAQFRSRLL